MSDNDRLVGRTLGDCRITSLLGRGGFASVYRAHQSGLERDVAVKVLDPLLARNPTAASRFDSEGRKAAALDHPNILPVYTAGEIDGLHYLTMRLVTGNTLADQLAERTRLEAARTLELLQPIAAALDHAHDRGVIHRDVKPANILTEDGRVWLADFGIAATAQTLGHYTSGPLGTAEYMAPEQAANAEIDGRADLYSLGCVAYECLTGRPPFQGEELVGVLMAHTTTAIPTTGNVALDAFMLRALAKDKEERFQSGAEFTAALADAVGGTVGSVPGRTVTARQQQGRYRTALIVSAAVVAGALVAGAFAAFVLLPGRPNAERAPRSAALAPGVRGPAVVRDPNGARYTLPGKWSVAGVSPDTDHYVTELRRGHTRVGSIEAMPPIKHSAAEIAASSTEWPCPQSLQTRSDVGSVTGVFCVFPSADAYVFYLVASGHDWVIELQQHGPSVDELVRFRESFLFDSSA